MGKIFNWEIWDRDVIGVANNKVNWLSIEPTIFGINKSVKEN